MKEPRRQLRSWGLIAALIGLAIGLAVAFTQALRAANSLETWNHEFIFWYASQLDLELNRLLDAGDRYAGGLAIDKAQLDQRIDILWSRITVFDAGSARRHLEAVGGARQAVESVRRVLTEYEPRLRALAPGDRAAYEPIRAAFAEIALPVHEMATRVMFSETRGSLATVERLQGNFRLAAGLIAALIVVGIVLIAYLIIDNAARRRLFDAMLASKEQARIASEREQEALIESGRRFRAIATANPVAMLVAARADGAIRYANATARALLGLPDDDDPARVALADVLVGRGDLATVLGAGERGQVDHHETRLRRKDGSDVPVSLSARAVDYDGAPCLVIGIMDLTETEAHRVLQATFANMAQGVAMFDRGHRLVAWNRQFRDLLRLPDALLTPTTGYIDFIAFLAQRGDLGDGSAAEHLERRLTTLDQPHVGERTLSDGTVLEVRRNPVPAGGFVTIYTDITALKQRENELADLVARLEAARDQATEANRTKSAFLANMSHELRTPLNAIIGYSEILKEEAQDQSLDGFLPDLDRIEAAGRHLLGVINDILDLSKIEAGKMDVYIEAFDVAALVDEVGSIIQPLAAKNHNRVDIVCPANIGAMRSDLTKVKQSLLNLLSNASKFTHRGTITLTVSHVATPTGPAMQFRVADTGIGMSAAEVARLFTAFSQADTATTKRFGGTGLGLAITRHFCTVLGGEVTVESEPGRGSAFTMTLPDRAAIPAPAAPARLAEAPEGAATILVVDDDPAVLDVLSFTLGKEGYRVIHAQSGEAAIEQARAHRPQAITLDVLMPRMDGWSVLMALKADPQLRDIPVVVVTILKERGVAFSLGALDFMTKPVDRTALTAMLRRHCPLPAGQPVLLIEDDPPTREATRRHLEKLGFAVAEAGNGAEALAWLDANGAPSVILLDLMMPVMDGFAFLGNLQKQSQLRDIPVVVLTGKQLTAGEKRVLAGRTEQVMAKESTSNLELTEAIRRCLRRSRPAPPRQGGNGPDDQPEAPPDDAQPLSAPKVRTA